jgi:hypothetical protein
MKKQYLYSEQSSLWGNPECIGFGNEKLYVKEIERKTANEIIIKNHYSKKFYNATYIHLGLYEDNELKGVLQYGYAMNPASCSSVVQGTKQDEYLELNRMWLSDEIEIKYPESQAVSMSISYIKKKFPKIKWIQSFADERCGGFGIVYQACSFNYYGEHTSLFWEFENVVYHNSLMTRSPNLSKSAKFIQENKENAISYELRQFRYIKFLDQREKKKCLLTEQPYPKHYKQ